MITLITAALAGAPVALAVAGLAEADDAQAPASPYRPLLLARGGDPRCG